MAKVELGITDAAFWIPNKKDMLFFDKIAVGNLVDELIQIADLSVRADWEYLASENYVEEFKFDMKDRKGKLLLSGNPVADADLDQPESGAVEFAVAVCGLSALYVNGAQTYAPDLDKLNCLTKTLIVGDGIDRAEVAAQAAQLLLTISSNYKIEPDLSKFLDFMSPLIKKATLRNIATLLTSQSIFSAIPIIPNPEIEGHLLINSTSRQVYSLVIDTLPVPSDDVSFHDIIQFRREDNTRSQIERLRRWMRGAERRLATEKTTAAELSDEFAGMLESYSEHMKLSQLKLKKSSVEFVFTSAAETIENMMKLKIGSVVKGFFKLRSDQVALAEAELKAPGREIAYIVRSSEKFS